MNLKALNTFQHRQSYEKIRQYQRHIDKIVGNGQDQAFHSAKPDPYNNVYMGWVVDFDVAHKLSPTELLDHNAKLTSYLLPAMQKLLHLAYQYRVKIFPRHQHFL